MTMAERRASESHGENIPRFDKLSYVRNYFGMSANGLKLYEREGLAHLGRDEDNDYRFCTLPDAVLICNAFDYTHYGFTLRETADILLRGDLAGQLASLDALSDRYNDQMEELVAKRRRLDRNREALRTYLSDPDACAVLENLDLWCLPIHTQELEMGPGNSDSQQWWTKAPLVTTGAIATLDPDTQQATQMWHGPVAEGRDVRRLDLSTGNAVHFCEQGHRYVHAFASYRADELPHRDTYERLFAFLEAQGLTLVGGSVLHRLLRYWEEDGVPLRVDEVFAPIA